MKTLLQILKEYPILKADEINALPTFSGPAFRSETGLKHEQERTAKDVIEHEESQLGKKLDIDPTVRKRLERFPARQVVWVTKTKEDAQKYGENVQQIDVGKNAKIIAQDNEGGYMVIFGRRPGRDYDDSL